MIKTSQGEIASGPRWQNRRSTQPGNRRPRESNRSQPEQPRPGHGARAWCTLPARVTATAVDVDKDGVAASTYKLENWVFVFLNERQSLDELGLKVGAKTTMSMET